MHSMISCILGYGGNPYGGRGGQDPYPPPPPPSYVRERDNYGNGPPGGYGGGGYNNGNNSYNSGPGGYGGGPNSYGGGGSYGGDGNNYGGGGYNNTGGGYGPGPSGYGSSGGGAGGRDNYGSSSGMNRSSTDAYGRYTIYLYRQSPNRVTKIWNMHWCTDLFLLNFRPTAGPSHSSYDDGLNPRGYQNQSSMGGADRRADSYGRYE